MKLTAKDYRLNAEEAEEMARKWPDPGLQKAYRDMATQWRNLAEQAERVEAKKMIRPIVRKRGGLPGMNAQCGRCGLTAAVIPTGRSAFRLMPSPWMISNCPVLIDRLQKKSSPLTGYELDCEHLSRAASAVFQECRRQEKP